MLAAQPIARSGHEKQLSQVGYESDSSRNKHKTSEIRYADPERRIRLLQDYSRQSLHFHKRADDLRGYDPGSYESAAHQSALLIRRTVAGSHTDVSPAFPLAPDARVGPLGGTEAIGFWESMLNGAPDIQER